MSYPLHLVTSSVRSKILRIEESHKKSISSNTCKVTDSPKRESDCIHSLCVLLIQVVVLLHSLSGLLWITVSLDYLWVSGPLLPLNADFHPLYSTFSAVAASVPLPSSNSTRTIQVRTQGSCLLRKGSETLWPHLLRIAATAATVLWGYLDQWRGTEWLMSLWRVLRF